VNIPLAPIGVRQAELTRDFLARCPIDHCYCSPLDRALETGSILAAPHHLTPQVVEELTECHVGEWEGLTWDEIARQYPRQYRLFQENPARHGYLGGETFAEVCERTTVALDGLLNRHDGETLLVVAHHVVIRTYLAGVLGLGPELARRVTLSNCGVSVVVRDQNETFVQTLNSHFHVLGAAASSGSNRALR
jgi:broad specificity phosphatase PhoE